MKQRFFSSRKASTCSSAVAALMGLHALSAHAVGVNTTPVTCNVLQGANIPAGALQYKGSGRFERQINRQVSTSNPKVYPFRTQPGTTMTASVALMAAPLKSQWQSVRPATLEVQQPDASGNWTTVCTTTAITPPTTANPNPTPLTCNATISAVQARIRMSTTDGTLVNDDKSAFTLTYNFAGPINAAEAQNQVSYTQTSGTLSINQTTKATLADQLTLPGAFEGQAVRLILTRSDASVVAEPNGPKLKGNDSAPQDDGTDFVCTNWYGAPANTKLCELVGTATRDSVIHMPFQLDPNVTVNVAHWGRVEVQRQFANGYVQATDSSKEFAKTCY